MSINTINLGHDVYGGKLNLTTGVLEFTHALVDLGSLNWTYATDAQRWGAIKSDMKNYPTRSADVIFEKYGTDTTASAGSENKGYIEQSYIYVHSTDSTNAPSGNAVYSLATPIEIDLTPTQINSLLGSNNIWHDGNGNISCEYYKTGCEPIARLIESYTDKPTFFNGTLFN